MRLDRWLLSKVAHDCGERLQRPAHLLRNALDALLLGLLRTGATPGWALMRRRGSKGHRKDKRGPGEASSRDRSVCTGKEPKKLSKEGKERNMEAVEAEGGGGDAPRFPKLLFVLF